METVLLIFIFLALFWFYVSTYFGEYFFPGQLTKKNGKKIITSCEVCSQFEAVKEISNKEQLAEVMTEIRKQLVLSSFKDTTQPAHCPSGEFLKLSLSPPWPDYIEHYFRCNECRANYRLSADTLGVEKYNNIQGELERY